MSDEQLHCPACGAPAVLVGDLGAPVPIARTVCSSLICPTNLETLDDVEEVALPLAR